MRSGSRRGSKSAASCGWTPAVKATSPGCRRAISRARAAASSDSPMQTIASAPAARARSMTPSRSASNAGSARWAWLSTKVVIETRPPPGGGGRIAVSARGRLPGSDGRLALARRGRTARRAAPLRHGVGTLALDPQQNRAGDEDRAEGADDDAEEEDPGERPQHLAAEDDEGEQTGDDRRARHDRSRQRLVHGAVERVVQRHALA